MNITGEQQPQPSSMVSSNLAVNEEEINLLDLLLVLLKFKSLIVWMVILAGVAAVIISLLMTNIYRSEATLIPRETEKPSGLSAVAGLSSLTGGMLGLGGDSNLSKLEVVLKSRDLAHRIVEKYNLIPILFKDDWDSTKKKWKTDNPPTEQDAFKALQEILSISTDSKKNTISVKFDHAEPKFAQQMVERFLIELSETLREDTLNDARGKQKFFQEQLTQTSDALLKEKIYALLAAEIEKETFARATKYYSFEVLDPPIVPDLNKKIKPKRAIICILSVICAFFLAIFAAFFLNFVEYLKKTANAEQLERLHSYLPLLRRRSRKKS